MRRISINLLALVLIIISIAVNPANAVTDGTVNCGTSGSFTIVSNKVTTNTNCRGSVTIPEGVTEVANGAFNISPDRSSYITSLSFPNSLTIIKESAFRAASSLTSIDFGTGIQSIVHWNFADSTALTSVTIPSSVTSIGVGVFYGSNQLENVTFLGSAPSVDSNAFNGLKAGAIAHVNSATSGFGANGSTWHYLIVSVPPTTTAPDAPTIGTATVLSPTSVSISFTAPTNNGGAAIQTYTATSTPGSVTGTLIQSGSGSVVVSGLTSSTAYTFRITATNSAGTSTASNATISVTTPTSDAELAAQAAARDSAALAAKKAAEVKREAEKQSALTDIWNCLGDSNSPTIIQFNTAEIYGVTKKNYDYIINDINVRIKDESATALLTDKNSTIVVVEQVVQKYVLLDNICKGEKFQDISANDLYVNGIIPNDNKTLITYNLRQYPKDQKDSYEKISAAIKEQEALVIKRKKRLSNVLLWNSIISYG